MRNIEFNVSEQTLTKKPSSPIVRGSKGYLRATFHFSNDWKGFKRIALFYDERGKENAVFIDSADSCPVPDEVTDGNNFRLSVTGILGNRRITTEVYIIRRFL